jgi:hypothetical protein
VGGKDVMVWTVNEPNQMMEVATSRLLFRTRVLTHLQAVRWGVNVILTDVTRTWLDLRTALHCKFVSLDAVATRASPDSTADYDKIGSKYGRIFLWTTLQFYTPFVLAHGRASKSYLESIGGPFDGLPIKA